MRYIPTDLSLPTYDQSQGTLSWERLYITTTPADTIRSTDTANTAPKTVRWSIDREIIDTPTQGTAKYSGTNGIYCINACVITK